MTRHVGLLSMTVYMLQLFIIYCKPMIKYKQTKVTYNPRMSTQEFLVRNEAYLLPMLHEAYLDAHLDRYADRKREERDDMKFYMTQHYFDFETQNLIEIMSELYIDYLQENA